MRHRKTGTAGIEVIHDLATAVDSQAKTVTLAKGQTRSTTSCCSAPALIFAGIRWEGYDQAAPCCPARLESGRSNPFAEKPARCHAQGGTFIMVAPRKSLPLPAGPYERASMVAHYFKQHKPKSKILILDAKDGFSKQGLFQDGWKQVYGDMIEWVPFSKTAKSPAWMPSN
ncbi:hypothetical protein [Alcaligenes faecalis]|uniref:hypothetical protein n=1 Tax=Alcaligenes faecalis TaxID=511 RepID=UPI001F0CA1D8|nr:hypothetical protein [Alcaligenes faecalis]